MIEPTPFRIPHGDIGVFAAVLAASCWAPSALGSPAFPGEVARELDMPCVPQCTLCHLDTNGGTGTVVRPFGQAMMAVGLEGKRPDLIVVVLDTLELASTDSDTDGRPDVEELREGRNPNQAGEGVLCATYGCNTRARSPAGSEAATLAFLTAAPFVVSLCRRRRRAHRVGGST